MRAQLTVRDAGAEMKSARPWGDGRAREAPVTETRKQGDYRVVGRRGRRPLHCRLTWEPSGLVQIAETAWLRCATCMSGPRLQGSLWTRCEVSPPAIAVQDRARHNALATAWQFVGIGGQCRR